MANSATNTLCFKPDCTVHAGVIPDAKMHAHGVPAFIFALGRTMEVKFKNGMTVTCRSVLMDAGVEHALITHGEPVAVSYLEHYSYATQKLRQAWLGKDKAVFDVIPRSRRAAAVFTDLLNSDFKALLGKHRSWSPMKMDSRVQVMFEKMVTQPGTIVTPFPDGFEVELGLSVSRFRHIFKAETGVSMQYYKQWLQASGFMRTLPAQSSLTHHALAHGYFDSSHFSNTYQKLIGVAPSKIIRNLGEVMVKKDLLVV